MGKMFFLVSGNHDRAMKMVSDKQEEAARLGEMLRRSKRAVVFTGAGISTESGIPDFRGPNGVWTRDPKAERMSNIHYYMSDPDVRKLSWQSRLNSPAWL